MKIVVKFVAIVMAMLFSVVTLTSCVTVKSGKVLELRGKTLQGNGIMTTKSVAVPEYSSLEVHRSIEVKITEQEGNMMVVTTDENVMPYVVVTCEGGKLVITIDSVIDTVQDINVSVALPQNNLIEYISVDSAAELYAMNLSLEHPLSINVSSSGEVDGSFTAQELKLNASSAAEISGKFYAEKIEIEGSSSAEYDGEVGADSISVTLSSASSAELSGECRELSVDASSAAEFEGELLMSSICKVTASSAASCEVACSKSLTASATSAGDVHYTATEGCVVNEHTSSGGKVKRVR